jgi:hypothetical protein
MLDFLAGPKLATAAAQTSADSPAADQLGSAQLVPEGALSAGLEANTVMPATAEAEVDADVQPVWLPGVYLTPHLAQMKYEQGR